MPRPSPYPPAFPPLELDLDDMSPSGLRPAPTFEPTLEPESGARPPSDKRNTVPPHFDLEEFAKEVMADGEASRGLSGELTWDADADADVDGARAPNLPDPPESEVRAISDTAKTGPPPAATSLYPEKSAIQRTLSGLHIELDDMLRAKDHRAALVVAEQILADDPEDIRARAAALRCQSTIEDMYAQRLGSLESVPRVAVPREEIPNLALDHRSGFILALVDGTCTLDMILDMASMPRLDVLRVLLELVQQGTITLE
jgi:hypothetical protein